MTARPRTLVLFVVLGGGLVAVSTGALFTRAAYASAGAGTLGGGLLLAVGRMGVTSGLTSASWARRGRPLAPLPPGTRWRTVLAGLLLGIHFATWLPSLAFTSIAASVTLVTTVPIWVALLLWLKGERPSARTGMGIAVAVAGGALVAFGDVDGLDSGSNPLLGDALALVAAITFAGHLLLSQSVQQRGLGLWQWTSVVTGLGALTVVPLVLVVAPGDGPYPLGFWAAALGLALVPQMVGHSSLIWSVRWLSPTLVSVAILLEPLFSSLGGIVLFDEVPGALVALGGLVLLAGVALTVVAEAGAAPTVAEDALVPT
ncbi:DMT family transporter [soil metagenome]